MSALSMRLGRYGRQPQLREESAHVCAEDADAAHDALPKMCIGTRNLCSWPGGRVRAGHRWGIAAMTLSGARLSWMLP